MKLREYLEESQKGPKEAEESFKRLKSVLRLEDFHFFQKVFSHSYKVKLPKDILQKYVLSERKIGPKLWEMVKKQAGSLHLSYALLGDVSTNKPGIGWDRLAKLLQSIQSPLLMDWQKLFQTVFDEMDLWERDLFFRIVTTSKNADLPWFVEKLWLSQTQTIFIPKEVSLCVCLRSYQTIGSRVYLGFSIRDRKNPGVWVPLGQIESTNLEEDQTSFWNFAAGNRVERMGNYQLLAPGFYGILLVEGYLLQNKRKAGFELYGIKWMGLGSESGLDDLDSTKKKFQIQS